VHHVSDLHLKFALRPHNVWQTSNLGPLRLGEEKKNEICLGAPKKNRTDLSC